MNINDIDTTEFDSELMRLIRNEMVYYDEITYLQPSHKVRKERSESLRCDEVLNEDDYAFCL